MEEQGPSVAVSDDMLAEGLPVEIFTEFDVNMDNVVEIDTEGESTGKISSIMHPIPRTTRLLFSGKRTVRAKQRSQKYLWPLR